MTVSLQETETQRRRGCEGRGRDWGEAHISHRMPKTARNHQKLGQWYGMVSLSEPPKETNPARERTVIFNYPVCGTLCYGSSRKLRRPIICLWKSYLNVKSGFFHFSFLISCRCMQAVNCCYLFAPTEIYPQLYLSLSYMVVVIFPVGLRAYQERKRTRFSLIYSV